MRVPPHFLEHYMDKKCAFLWPLCNFQHQFAGIILLELLYASACNELICAGIIYMNVVVGQMLKWTFIGKDHWFVILLLYIFMQGFLYPQRKAFMQYRWVSVVKPVISTLLLLGPIVSSAFRSTFSVPL